MSDFLVSSDPYIQFKLWFDEAVLHPGIKDSDACFVSTIDLEGYPEGRVVLLKGVSDRGFVFYTNSHSTKGKSLAETTKASMVFYWDELGYQVRIVGDVERVSDPEADAYFATRSRGSQLGAWASQQSDVLGSRDELVAQVDHYTRQFEGQVVSRPPHWVGYRILPKKIEFWKDQPYRLHDRFLYTRLTDGAWRIDRLNP